MLYSYTFDILYMFNMKLFICHAGKTERMEDTSTSDLSPVSSGVDSGQQSPVSQENMKNNKSIRKLWGK